MASAQEHYQAMTDLDVYARTVWGEARGEGLDGMQAVAAVIWNRVKSPRWWGKDVQSVCLKPFQFSCWNMSDPNRDKLLAVTAKDPQFAEALDICAQALAGNLADPTNGANSYYSSASMAPPYWALSIQPTAKIGNHVFYRIA
jgi:spore germination cell wall hydrolase CwlJ-like protein